MFLVTVYVLRVQSKAEDGTAVFSVFGFDLTAVGLYDGGADGKADAVVLFLPVGGLAPALKIAVEDPLQKIGRDAAAVVRNLKNRPLLPQKYPKRQDSHALGVADGIFQNVQNHLLDEDGVHGNYHDFIGDLKLDLPAGKALSEIYTDGIDQLLQHRGRGENLYLPRVNTGDGEEVFHHPHQPFRILLDALDHLDVLLLRQRIAAFKQGGGRAVYGGQRRAQIVGYGPEQIGPHPFLFALGLYCLVPLQLGGKRTCQHGHDDHHRRGDKIHRQGIAQRKIGEGESVIHRCRSCHRRRDAVYISLRHEGNEKHRKNEHRGDVLLHVKNVLEQKADEKGQKKNQQGRADVLQNGGTLRHGKSPFGGLFYDTAFSIKMR